MTTPKVDACRFCACRFYEEETGNRIDRLWYVSRTGFRGEARERCQAEGICFSTTRDVVQLERVVAEQNPRHPPSGKIPVVPGPEGMGNSADRRGLVVATSPLECLERNVKLVVGLGNPGSRYSNTRHNVGFMVLDRLARRAGAALTRRQCSALVGLGQIGGERVCMAKPQTYMNLSGEAVACLLRFYKISPEDLLVVYDDRDLPAGRIRLREKGSAGGHRGMESIIGMVGTSEFPRLRIGIGRPEEMDAVDHVLGSFSAEERPLMEAALDRAVEAVECALSHGTVPAMNRFNAS